MKTLKKWGKPVTEVQRFVPQYCTSSCLLTVGRKLYWSLGREFDGIPNERSNKEIGRYDVWYLLNPEPEETGWVPLTGDSYFSYSVDSYHLFKRDGNNKFTETFTDEYVNWIHDNYDNDPTVNVNITNTFYRSNAFTAETITEENKNLS